jgi:sugar transferase (PEP-CTERM/EpsH1 system associated)
MNKELTETPVAGPLNPMSMDSSNSAKGSSSVAPSKPGRILHVLNRLDAGGTEYAALRIINGLEEFEHAICVTRGVSPAWSSSGCRVRAIFTVGDVAHDRQLLLPKLCQVMKSYRPDIVHSRNWGAIESILAARLAGVPVVIHSEHGYELDQLGGLPLRQRLFRSLSYAFADAVFAVSRQLRDFHAQQSWRGRQKLRVIYNGVDPSRFARPDGATHRKRSAWGIPAGRMVVGSVGRMVRIKDYQTLLQAADLLLSSGLDLQVVLAGDGPERPRLEQWARNSTLLRERVTFLGAIQDVEAVLPAFDAFVLPSLAEGMSNTLLEAMACGLPIVASRVGGNPELVDDGSSGLLFTAGSTRELTDKLASVVTDRGLRERLGAEARKKAQLEFSLSRMLTEYRKLYLDCAGRHNLAIGTNRELVCAE